MQSITRNKKVLVWSGSLLLGKILLISSLVFSTSWARMAAASLSACPCTLTWNQNHDPAVSGYRLYYGIVGSTTTNRLNVGMANLVTLNNLLSSSNYFFYVVAYDSSGIESLPSNVMCYTPQALSAMKLTRLANGTLNLHFLTATGAACHVEFTSLTPPHWQILCGATADATGNVTITNLLPGNSSVQLYRAVRP